MPLMWERDAGLIEPWTPHAMTLRPKALPRAPVVPLVPLRAARGVCGPGRVPALQGWAVVLRPGPGRLNAKFARALIALRSLPDEPVGPPAIPPTAPRPQ